MDVQLRYSVEDVSAVFGGVPSREQLLRLENAIRTELAPVETPITHHFSDGIYAREMFIPAGTVVTGKIHKREHLFMILKGDVSILTESGVKRLQAPCILNGHPGIKRAAFAHEDTICVAIHGTHKTDVNEIEREFTADSFLEYEQFLLEHKV